MTSDPPLRETKVALGSRLHAVQLVSTQHHGSCSVAFVNLSSFDDRLSPRRCSVSPVALRERQDRSVWSSRTRRHLQMKKNLEQQITINCYSEQQEFVFSFTFLLCVFATIVPSHIIYVNRPQKFLHTV